MYISDFLILEKQVKPSIVLGYTDHLDFWHNKE